MTILTSINNPVWRDTATSVHVNGGNGRYEVRWPVPGLMNESGIPDFTTFEDATSYAEHIARSIRFQRELAHEQALWEDARRAAAVATRTTTIDLVLRGQDGICRVMIGRDEYRDAVAMGRVLHSGFSWTRAQLEYDQGPIEVLHSIEIRGELA